MKDFSDPQLDSNILLKGLFDDAQDLIQVVHLDGTVIMVNTAWLKILGYTLEEINKRSIYSFILEEDRERYKNYRAQIICGQLANMPIVYNLQTKDGRTIPVEGMVSVKNENGKAVYTRGILRDISARLASERQLKELNDELREREQNLQLLLLQAPDAVVVINKESNVTFWNPKAEALFGWKAEEVLQKSLAEAIIPHQYRDAHNKGMQRFLATGEGRVLNKTIEISALKKNEEEFYVALTISPTLQAGETAFIAFIRDITAQKKNLLDLENKTRQLERSNAYLEDFAHAASHDLQEPLRKILTFADRLKSGLQKHLTDTDSKYFERLEASASRMQCLVDDLLEFSSVSDKEQELESVDLNAKVQKVLEELELLIEEKGATVITSDLPIVKGNRRQLLQLFQNLIGNSLKYNRPGLPPKILVRSQLVKGIDAPIELPASHAEHMFHLIEVEDNGIGFEQAHAQKIFEVFRRLHGKAEYAGTGVGLAIASKVVSNHNGHIWATGRPALGATFHILLPVVG